MNELLKHSLLCGLLTRLRALYESSLLAALLRALRGSRFAAACRRLLAAPPAAEGSRLHRVLCGVNRLLFRLGQGIRVRLDGSLLLRGLRHVRAACGQSLLLGRFGLLRCVLVTLGLFGVVDWLLRDVLAVPVLSSVWDELLLLLGALLLLRQRMSARAPLPARTSEMTFPLLQFFAVCLTLLVLTADGDWPLAVTGLRATVQSMLWFPLLLRLLRDRKDVRTVYLCAVFAAFAISLHGILQYVFAAPIPAEWTDAAEPAVRTRVYSIFGSPNILGDCMVLFAPMALALAYTARRRSRRLLALAMTACMLLCCLFTMSRGAWIGMFVAALVFALLTDLRLIALLLTGSVLSLALPFVSGRVLYLFTQAFANSASLGGRALRWQKALGYLNDSGRPWYGLGFGRFGGAVAMQNPVNPGWEYFYVDNYYIKLLAENGWLGLGSYVLLLLGLLWSGLRAWARRRRSGARPLVAGILAGLCGVITHCFFENIFEEPYMLAWFWCAAALMVFLGRKQEASA